MNDYYVYLISRPDGRPCYIGKGRRSRWKMHAKNTHNVHLARIYAKYGDMPIAKLHEGLTNEQACEIEINLIASIGRYAHGGPLVNQTDGGEGAAGADRECMRRPEVREKIAAAHRGKKLSDEHKAKISAAGKGRKHSPETLAKLSAKAKARTISPEQRAKIGMSRRGKGHTQETRDRIAEAGRLRGPISEETRAKMRASALKRSPEQQAVFTANMLAGRRRMGKK